MTRGGARVNSGPPPDPNALRRDRKDDRAGWITLPSEGRSRPAPGWPLPAPTPNPVDAARVGDDVEAAGELLRDEIEREHELWEHLWSKPQAVMWERLRCADEVAIYVRLRVRGERDGNVKLLAEARMRGDRLGVDPASMMRLRWKIATDEVAARRQEQAETSGTTARRGSSVRDRAMRVVTGGA